MNTQLQEGLASILSRNAIITGPTDATWADVTERYMQHVKPHVKFSVSPGEEGDVAKIVRLIWTLFGSRVTNGPRCDSPTITTSPFTQSTVAML